MEDFSVEQVATDKYKKKIITIPNLLSLVRICLIPLIIWLFAVKEDYLLTGITVIFSGLTDVVDGFIARRFNMISDLGKVLDPFADKATQLTVIVLLIIRFPLMVLPLGIGVIKEIFMAISGYMVVKKCDVVLSAEWHGKLATVILTVAMALHLIWSEIPKAVSATLIIISALSIALSLVLYAKRNIDYLINKKKGGCHIW